MNIEMNNNIYINVIFLFIMFFYGNNIFAQNTADSITNNKIKQSQKESKLYLNSLKSNNFNSTKKIINNWEIKCGITEPIYRAKILFAIQNDLTLDSALFTEAINNIFKFKERYLKTRYLLNKTTYNDTLYFDYIAFEQSFDSLTTIIAKNNINKYSNKSDEYFFCELYSAHKKNDSIFYYLKDNKNSKLYNKYTNVIEKYKKETEVCLSGLVGAWIPMGKLSIIGILPQYGPLLEISKNNYILSVKVSLIGIGAEISNDFLAKRNNKLEKTNVFSAGSIGLSVGRTLFFRKNNQIYLIGGIVYTGATVFNYDKENNLPSVGANTFGYNIGLNYKHYIIDNFFLGVSTKYNFVDYSRSGVIDLTGNTISIQVMIGASISSKYRKLKVLEYL